MVKTLLGLFLALLLNLVGLVLIAHTAPRWRYWMGNFCIVLSGIVLHVVLN